MLDIKWIRDNNPDAFLKGLTSRGFDDPQATLNRILSLDEQRRTTIQKLQEAQARRRGAGTAGVAAPHPELAPAHPGEAEPGRVDRLEDASVRGDFEASPLPAEAEEELGILAAGAAAGEIEAGALPRRARPPEQSVAGVAGFDHAVAADRTDDGWSLDVRARSGKPHMTGTITR